jgi:(R,R)-butanediol dehydrogenase/meso-butanediol dehydrogenase/diacetyl reductase
VRAAVLPEVGQQLVVQDVPDPTPGTGEVILEVEAAGICGSDLHLSDSLAPVGAIFGHEYAGRVVEVGDGVSRGLIGTTAAGFPLVGCGSCSWCRAGLTARCAAYELNGLQRPGAYAELVRMSTAQLEPLPASLDAGAGALVEPLAVALHALDRAQLRPAEPVLVLGAGPVGMAVTLWARTLGASAVVVSDPAAGRRELALRMGATAVVDPTSEDVGAAFADATGQQARVVVECVGVPGLIGQAVKAAGHDARIVVVGVCMAMDELYPLDALNREADLSFVMYYRRDDFGRTVRALDSGRLDASGLITDTIGLDEAPARFAALKQPTTECKVQIQPGR